MEDKHLSFLVTNMSPLTNSSSALSSRCSLEASSSITESGLQETGTPFFQMQIPSQEVSFTPVYMIIETALSLVINLKKGKILILGHPCKVKSTWGVPALGICHRQSFSWSSDMPPTWADLILLWVNSLFHYRATVLRHLSSGRRRDHKLGWIVFT